MLHRPEVVWNALERLWQRRKYKNWRRVDYYRYALKEGNMFRVGWQSWSGRKVGTDEKKLDQTMFTCSPEELTMFYPTCPNISNSLERIIYSRNWRWERAPAYQIIEGKHNFGIRIRGTELALQVDEPLRIYRDGTTNGRSYKRIVNNKARIQFNKKFLAFKQHVDLKLLLIDPQPHTEKWMNDNKLNPLFKNYCRYKSVSLEDILLIKRGFEFEKHYLENRRRMLQVQAGIIRYVFGN